MTPAMFFFFLLAVPRGLQDSQFLDNEPKEVGKIIEQAGYKQKDTQQ